MFFFFDDIDRPLEFVTEHFFVDVAAAAAAAAVLSGQWAKT